MNVGRRGLVWKDFLLERDFMEARVGIERLPQM